VQRMLDPHNKTMQHGVVKTKRENSTPLCK